ncbi:MAG TPA: carboxylating nicotinate-nucleotide diphosphorylase [Alphaproteobacteria bacterium]|nr:carboxylating nicotinate-nucleotide diphosphorylase [Alphaproteobacteria bacterium]
MMLLQLQQVKQLIQAAIEEDMGRGDVTTEATIAEDLMCRAHLIAKQEMVLAGIEVFAGVYASLDPSITITAHRKDGDRLMPKTVIADLVGRARMLLAGERVALNFLQRLSGIATLTRQYVDAVRGYKVDIIDTRKTTAGWRVLEKYAVRIGGGKNHRHDLGDGVLIKDNHIVAAGGIKPAIDKARRYCHHLLKIEVEVETLEQAEEALQAGADVIMLDNMSPEQLAEAVKMIGGRVVVEASGGISLESVVAVARTGVDLISVGKLTHSAPAADIHIEFDSAQSVP